MHAKKNKLDHKFEPVNVKHKDYEYNGFLTEEESDGKILEGEKKETADLSSMPSLEVGKK